MAFLTDIPDFIDTDEFAIAVTIDGSPVNVIFDNAWAQVQEGEAGVSSLFPIMLCASSDVSATAIGDAVVDGSTNYVVRDIQADGTGMTTLVLELQ